MSILKTIMLGLMIVLLLPHQTHSDQIPQVKAEVVQAKEEAEIAKPLVPLTTEQLADKYALQYGIDASVFKKVMKCESGGNVKVRPGDGGRANGVMQFHKGTFLSYEKKLGVDLNYNSHEDQIRLAAYMFSIGEARHWTTYRAVKNGGTYSFYSKLLKKHYTITCK